VLNDDFALKVTTMKQLKLGQNCSDEAMKCLMLLKNRSDEAFNASSLLHYQHYLNS
jgi:hypothetical protein